MLRDLKSTLPKLNYLLDKRRKVLLVALFFMGIVFSVIETAGISLVMLFISVATNPDLLQTGWYMFFFDLLGFTNTTRFVIFFGIAIIVFYFFRGAYQIFYNYILQKYSWSAYRRFATRLFKTYLALPYKAYIQKNPSVLSQMITVESKNLSQLLLNFLQIFSELFTVLLLYGLMLVVNFQMTLALTAILLLIFFIVFLTIIRTSKRLGVKRYEAKVELSKTIWGTLNNFKFIKLKGNETEISKTFANSILGVSRTSVLSTTLGKLPKSIIENLGFSLLIASVCFILWRYDSAEMIIPVISMYALALYRMLPGIIRILGHFNSIAFSHHSLQKMYEDYNLETDNEGSEPLNFTKAIRAEGLSFSYLTGGEVIKDVSFEIRAGEKVAFVGESGGGKTTLVDIIIGIYRPLKGNLYIDDVLVDKDNIRSWRSKIGYIPQNIYLFDGTVGENVAFGSEYDEEKITRALKKAKIWDMLEKKEGIHTIVGDRGIKLSGGQQQRVGIARALYNDPQVLVLDEATSSLDNATEAEIMDEIYDASGNKTLIIIAHRLSTVERCDRQIHIDSGRINE